jgi:transposase
MSKKLTEQELLAQIKQVRELREQGKSTLEIAAITHMSVSAAKRRLSKGAEKWAHTPAGYGHNKIRFSVAQKETALALLMDGHSRDHVSDQIGTSFAGVQNIIAELKSEGRLPAKLPSYPAQSQRRHAKTTSTKRVQMAEAPMPTPIRTDCWTKAREIAAHRMLRARHNLDHIAEALNGLPGPAVLPRDVVSFKSQWA